MEVEDHEQARIGSEEEIDTLFEMHNEEILQDMAEMKAHGSDWRDDEVGDNEINEED